MKSPKPVLSAVPLNKLFGTLLTGKALILILGSFLLVLVRLDMLDMLVIASSLFNHENLFWASKGAQSNGEQIFPQDLCPGSLSHSLCCCCHCSTCCHSLLNQSRFSLLNDGGPAVLRERSGLLIITRDQPWL